MEKGGITVKKRNRRGIIGLIIKILFLLIFLGLILIFLFAREEKLNSNVSMMSKVNAVLMDEKTISQLNTLRVPYAGIYQKKNANGDNELLIAYKGTVDFGIDFDSIELVEGENENEIKVILPEVTLKNYFIDPNSLSSIPNERKEELRSRLILCEKDLQSKFSGDEEMKKLAKDSARETVVNFLEPIVRSINKEGKLLVSNK